jgi:hypothetical protein
MSDVTVQPFNPDKDMGKLGITDGDNGASATVDANGLHNNDPMSIQMDSDAVDTSKSDKQSLDQLEDGTPDSANPQLLAGKYKDEGALRQGILEVLSKKHDGDLVAAYKELESTLGKSEDDVAENTGDAQPDNADKEATKNDDSDATKDDDTPNDGDSEADGEPLDFTGFVKEFSESGSLSEDSYTKLADVGYDRETVDVYLDGINYRMNQMADIVGGMDNYKAMTGWAKEALTEAEQTAYNNDLASGDKTRISNAITLLGQKYDSTVGFKPGRKINPESGGNSPSVQGYQSSAEMERDMADARYKTDSAFRTMVMQKIARSKVL